MGPWHILHTKITPAEIQLLCAAYTLNTKTLTEIQLLLEGKFTIHMKHQISGYKYYLAAIP